MNNIRSSIRIEVLPPTKSEPPPLASVTTSIHPSIRVEVLPPTKSESPPLTSVTTSIHPNTTNSITLSGKGSSSTSIGRVAPMPSNVPASKTSRKMGELFNYYTETPYDITRLTYPYQGFYAGKMQFGRPNGQGTFTYFDGRGYKGGFINGTFHGEGTFTYPDGRVYKGGFINGKFHGEGTFTYPDGRAYTGGFINGKFHGEGTFTYPNGKVLKGTFINGNFVEDNLKVIFLDKKTSEREPSRNNKAPEEKKLPYPNSASNHQKTLRNDQNSFCVIQ